MKFTRSGVLATAVAVAFTMPTVSHAAGGTITITGQISSQTCTVNGGGAGSGNITLTQCANTGGVSTSFKADPAPVGTAAAKLVNSNGADTGSVSTPVMYSLVYQ